LAIGVWRVGNLGQTAEANNAIISLNLVGNPHHTCIKKTKE
jgi:hypothetical protein